MAGGQLGPILFVVHRTLTVPPSRCCTESAQSSALLIAHTLADEGGLHAWSSEHFTMAKHLTVTTNYARYVLLILLGVYGERDDEDFVPHCRHLLLSFAFWCHTYHGSQQQLFVAKKPAEVAQRLL